MATFQTYDVGNGLAAQKVSLRKIAELIAKGIEDPEVIRAARAITAACDSRDEQCEIEAIYDAVKFGTDKVPGLKDGVRYVSDPRTIDYFSGARAMLRECKSGACAGDCDDHTILVAALLGALGYKVGARAYGRNPNANVFEHVYAVVALPKHGPWPKDYSGHGMDTTVPDAYAGWQPRKGKVLTYWIEEE